MAIHDPWQPPRKRNMQLSQERVIGCLEDGVSVLQAKDDDFTQYEVVIDTKEEHAYWASQLEVENDVAHEERSQENFMLAA